MVESGEAFVNKGNLKDFVEVREVTKEDGELLVVFTRYGRDTRFGLPVLDFLDKFARVKKDGDK